MGSVEVARKINDVTEEKKLQRESGVGFDGRFFVSHTKTEIPDEQSGYRKRNGPRLEQQTTERILSTWVSMDLGGVGYTRRRRRGKKQE
jgi:hypothetical protein